MKTLLKLLIMVASTILFNGAIYLIWAFTVWDINVFSNVSEWGGLGRFICIFLLLWLNAIPIVSTPTVLKEFERYTK